MLNSLVELARQTSRDSRREMMHSLSQLFVDGAEKHTSREVELFGDVLGSLLVHVDMADRQALSELICHLTNTPHPLALKLANDDAPVASPILEFSPVLTVSDLVGIAGIASQKHLQAIARRREIIEPVTEVIVGRGEMLTLTTVVSNLTARFSLRAINQIGSRAMIDPLLGDALSLRRDLPVETARRIVGALSPEARKRVERMLHQNGGLVTDLLGKAMRVIDTARRDPASQKRDPRQVLKDIKSGYRNLDDALDDLLAQQRTNELIALLASLCNLPEVHVNNVFHRVNVNGIGIVCRSLGLGDATFRRLCAMRCDRLRLPMTQTDQMVREYQAITLDTAIKTLDYQRRMSGMPAQRQSAIR